MIKTSQSSLQGDWGNPFHINVLCYHKINLHPFTSAQPASSTACQVSQTQSQPSKLLQASSAGCPISNEGVLSETETSPHMANHKIFHWHTYWNRTATFPVALVLAQFTLCPPRTFHSFCVLNIKTRAPWTRVSPCSPLRLI